MIIILESHHVTLSQSQVETFKNYFQLFEELNGLITIVHTHSPNQFRLPGLNPGHDKKLKERSDIFNQILGREIPTMRIDCNRDENGPAHSCMTRNAIRQILEVAKVKTPVYKSTTQVRKLEKMIFVDILVNGKYKAKLDEYLKRCENESQILTVEIENIEREIEEVNNDIRRHDTDELLQLFEHRYDEQVGFFGWFSDVFGRADHVHTMEFSAQKHTIDGIDVAQYGINVLEESGGKGNNFWNVEFKRHTFSSGYYHVVLKTKKSTKFREAIKGWRSYVESLNERLKTKKQGQLTLGGWQVDDSSDGSSNKFVKLRNLITNCRRIAGIAAAQTLPLELFMELADAGFYQGTNAIDEADALEKFLANKFGIA